MSDITPIVKIYYTSDKYWDISPIVTKVDFMYGRNQPFMYQEVEVNKLYFSSASAYWDENATSSTPKDGTTVLLPSDNILDGQTKVDISAYGNAYTLILERHETTDDIVSLICYNSAYYMQNSGTLAKSTTIYIESGVPYIYGIGPMHNLGDKYTLSRTLVNQQYKLTYNIANNSNYKIIFWTNAKAFSQSVGTIYNKGDVVLYSSKFYICTNSTGSSSQSPQWPTNASYWTDSGEFSPLYIEATGSDIFRFFSYIVSNYSEYVIDSGYSYNYGDSIRTSYTLADIENIKNDVAHLKFTEDTFKIRVNNNYSCWDILKQIGGQSNRWPFFYDKAYFVDYVSTNSERDTITQFDIDYGVDNNGASKTRFVKSGSSTPNYIDLYQIVKNADQGSEYVQTQQTVYSETYSTQVRISNSINTSEGYPLYLPYPESNPGANNVNNSERNLMLRKVAFNRIVQNYKPQDAVQLQYSEVSNTSAIKPIGIYASVSDLPSNQPNGTYAIVIDSGFIHKYFRYSTSTRTWTLRNANNMAQIGQYEQKFKPYTLAQTINDVQNGIVLNNAPLACVEVLWPNCITEVTFGNPEFMDAQKQWKSLSLESQIATIQGSEDQHISDRYSSKLVIGNQTLSDLQDNRQGFTGLIMEKNYDNELYRLSGYNNGVLEAYFNSQGEIMSGNGTVIINHDGITIGQGGSHIDPSLTNNIETWDKYKSYEQGTIVVWYDKLYVCSTGYTVPQGSEGFEPGTVGGSSYWVCKADVATSQESADHADLWEWEQNSSYAVGDVVTYDGKIWICVKAYTNETHTPSLTNTEYWTTQVPLWSVTTLYKSGDYVIYNGMLYKCIKNLTLTAIAPDSETGFSYWTVVMDVTKANQQIVAGSWDSNETAPPQDVNKKNCTTIDSKGLTTYDGEGKAVCFVGTDGNIYGLHISANQITAGKLASDYIDTEHLSIGGKATYADTQGTANIGIWVSGKTYTQGDTILYIPNYTVYRCISGHTASSANSPASSASQNYWAPCNANKQVTADKTSLQVWAEGTHYTVGEEVLYSVDNVSYRCSTEHTSSQEIIPTNTSYWTGINAQSANQQKLREWQPNIYYEVGDEVVYKKSGSQYSIHYRCKLAHTSSASITPTITNYWDGVDSRYSDYSYQSGLQEWQTNQDSQESASKQNLRLWKENESYKPGDNVLYSANKIYYRCSQEHTSSTSLTPTNPNYWTPINAYEAEEAKYQQTQGVQDSAQNLEQYSASKQYGLYDVVQYYGKVYVHTSSTTTTGVPPSNSTYWSCEANYSQNTSSVGQKVEGYIEINPEIGMATYDIVSYEGHSAGSLQCKIGTDGAIMAGGGAVRLNKYGLFTYPLQYRSIPGYSQSTTYRQGDRVIYDDGQLWEALRTVTGKNPIGHPSDWKYVTDEGRTGKVAQCKIGTDGTIQQANGIVYLNMYGLNVTSIDDTASQWNEPGGVRLYNSNGSFSGGLFSVGDVISVRGIYGNTCTQGSFSGATVTNSSTYSFLNLFQDGTARVTKQFQETSKYSGIYNLGSYIKTNIATGFMYTDQGMAFIWGSQSISSSGYTVTYPSDVRPYISSTIQVVCTSTITGNYIVVTDSSSTGFTAKPSSDTGVINWFAIVRTF